MEQQQELAARDNGGPYGEKRHGENDRAQRYGRDFARQLDQAGNAIR
ncbi:hypothetical protein [Streptomyces sp. bgisy022]